MNDQSKRIFQAFVSRIGDWLYDHAAETLALLVAAIAGACFGLWLHLGRIDERLDSVEANQLDGRLCQRITQCAGIVSVTDVAEDCEKWQALCNERISVLIGRMTEVERRLYDLTTRKP